jgi:Heparinase II/III-like protein/Heparinase II/III N-terminus
MPGRRSGMKLRTLASTVQNESLQTLLGEAGWRGIRAIRRRIFQIAGQDGLCPVRFHPIGYFQSQRQPVSDRSFADIVAYADSILQGSYPLLGYGSPRLGVYPNWHCDWVSGRSWPLEASGKIRIVRHDGSDVKAPWELSRLQFCPVVAKAYMLTGDRRYRGALESLLTDWIARNPVGQGVNWTVAMEAALRAISVCLTMELLWPFTSEEKPWLDGMTAWLWQHLRFIEAYSEFSFRVRSNHYLSNIVGLTTLSAYLQGRGMQQRLRKYAGAVQREVLLQTYEDGGDREASTGYHVLVAQLALHSFIVQQRCGCTIAPAFEARLRLMFEWISTLADDAWKLPYVGDCDNGRVELLADDIAETMLPACERHSLRVKSLCVLATQLLGLPMDDGEHASKHVRKPASLLRESGLAVLRAGDASVVFCAMPNGLQGKGSHTHCDKLSIVFRLNSEEVFCDSGSRCYTRSAELRNLDRSTKAHNTLMIDGAEQNIIPSDPGFLFQCGNEAVVSRIVISENGELAVRASHHGYSTVGVVHRRTVQLTERSLLVLDELSGAEKHVLEIRYILGPAWRVSSEMMTGEMVSCAITGPHRLSLQCEAESPLTLIILPVQISREYGAELPTSCIRIQTTACLPAKVQTRVKWD